MNNKISCIIVDDEPLARDLLKNYILKLPFLDLITECSSAIEALSTIKQQRIDLIFMDIEMPEIDGLTFMRTLLPQNQDVIFTTAYSEYAVQGFENDAVDYLLKPITMERFLQSINKVMRRNAVKYEISTVEPEKIELKFDHDFEPEQRVAETESNKLLLVKQNKKYVRVLHDDIIYIEGMKDYVKVHIKDKSTLITHMTMTKMESLLPPDGFLRINRSFIVNKLAIQFIDGNNIKLSTGEELVIGVNYREKIRLLLKDSRI